MKTFFIAIAVLVLTPITAQNNCSPFYPNEEGKTLTIHQLDKREKLSTIIEYTVTEASSAGMTVAMNLKDKRGKIITQGSFNAVCSEGTTRLDPASVMVSQMQQYEGMEYSITGDDLFFPNAMSVGQDLPNTETTMVVEAGMMNITSTVSMTDRKVERQETITTPAGTFDCYVITFTNTLKMGLSRTMHTTQWIANGVGMVKEETRKSNGNLITKSILHSVN